MGLTSSSPAAGRKSHHAIVLGVPGAGRKTLARALLNGAPLKPAQPCVPGMEVLTGQRACDTWHSGKMMRVTTWSVGGSDRMKPLWPRWAEGATHVVFAVDAAGGEERTALARAELTGLGVMQWAASLPLVVVATKCDVDAPGALDAGGVADALCRDGVPWPGAGGAAGARAWTCVPCSATAGTGVGSVLQAVAGS